MITKVSSYMIISFHIYINMHRGIQEDWIENFGLEYFGPDNLRLIFKIPSFDIIQSIKYTKL